MSQLLSVGVSFLIFSSFALALVVHPGALPGDIAILRALHQTATPTLDHVAVSITDFGMVKGVLPVAGAIALLLLYTRQWNTLAYWLLAFIGNSGIGALIKLLWHRARPHLWDAFYPYPKDFSFPSGHAMASMTLVATLLVLLWPTRWRWAMLLVGCLFVVVIGWTRLYLGVHYPSDVVAGWMVAIAWVLLSKAVLQLLQNPA